MKAGNPQVKVNVTVLNTEGCLQTNSAIETIKHVANDLNIPVELKTIRITSQEQAVKHRFLGSPSIRVNGLDIEPNARDLELFGLA